MGFFDDAIREWAPEPAWEPPIWMDPPGGVVPAYSDQRAIVFRNGQVMLVVDRFLVYPEGLCLTITLWVRTETPGMIDVPFEMHYPPRDGTVPDDFLRFGVLFADGSTWSNLDWHYPAVDEDPAGPVISGQGGGGGRASWVMSYWMWPLPPEGLMTFVAEWPAYAIEESRASVDATELRTRADEAEVIWPN